MSDRAKRLSKVMPATLHNLLHGCLCPRNSCRGAGSGGRTSMALQPNQGEEVFFFSIDDQSNQQCAFRDRIGLEGRISDCLVYFKQGANKSLCIVELKGSDLSEAAEQIISTHRALREAMKGQRDCQTVALKAYIFRFGSSPNMPRREGRDLQARLSAHLGTANYKISSQRDIGPFLRGSGEPS